MLRRTPPLALALGALLACQTTEAAPILALHAGTERAHASPLPVAGARAVDTTAEIIVARGGGQELEARRLDQVLLARYALSSNGRELLRVLVGSRLIRLLARAQNVSADADEVRAAWNKLNERSRATGTSRGLADELRRAGMDPEEFRRDYLPLTILHEKLTRAALGLPAGAAVTAGQQEIWLQSEKDERGEELFRPPWPGGVVARCGEIEIGPAEFGRLLRTRLPPDDVRRSAWHCLMQRAIEARMPDLAPRAKARAVEVELKRRRRQQEAEHPGLTYEQILAAQGRSLEMMRDDASMHVAVLARVWVDRARGEQGLKTAYEAERTLFEGRFGRAIRAHMLFLDAAHSKNQFIQRTFDEAERELQRMRTHVGNTDDFAALCTEFSEEPNTSKRRGELGFVTYADPRWPEPIRRALFDWADRNKEVPTEGTPVGPIRLNAPAGSALFWISALRPSPPWEVMSERVHEELRRRFLESVLPERDVEMVP